MLGTATDQEQRAVQCLSGIYPEIAEALAELREGLEGYANVHAVEPPAELKSSIMAAIEGVEQEDDDAAAPVLKAIPVADAKSDAGATAPTESAAPALHPTEEKPRSTGWWAAAACLALLVFAGWGLLKQQGDIEATQEQLASIESQIEALGEDQAAIQADAEAAREEAAALDAQLAVLRDPATQKVALAGTDNLPDGSALVFWNAESGKAYLDASGLPEPAAGKQYQLWAIVDGQPTDMGVFDLATASDTIQEMVTVAEPQAFAITLEDAGGHPTPNLDALQVIGNVAS